MSKTNLMGYTLDQLEETMASMGEKSYRGRQLFKWLYHNREHDFDLLTDLSKELRNRLARTYEIRGLEIRERVRSVDGTEKFLFRLEDDEVIETVLIPDNDRRTVCISSQVGCALNCQFCATGRDCRSVGHAAGVVRRGLFHQRRVHGDGGATAES